MNSHETIASLKSSAVISAINALMVVLLMAFLWWSVVPSLDRIIEQEDASAVRDAEHTKALDAALQKSIENQERNRKLLEESIKAFKAAQPPEAKQ